MNSALRLYDMPPGRVCPADYRYSPSVLARARDFACDTLYVAGGLYGNLAAFEEIERMAASETRPATIVFNGDFHWFDAEPEWFGATERGVSRHRALRGNVETEISRTADIGAGCGCAYPETVSENVVGWSNRILADLQIAARDDAGTIGRLAALPMHLVAEIADRRIGIVHGDAWSLAGWRFAHDALDNPAQRDDIGQLQDRTGIDVFASTHTCLAALRQFGTARGRLTIVNNGAAGMPNFSGSAFGLVSRISASPSPHTPLYGCMAGGLHVDALAVRYDRNAFLKRFLSRWPEGSPAHLSYFGRIANGPDYPLARARPQISAPA